jgi:hypothetical protein
MNEEGWSGNGCGLFLSIIPAFVWRTEEIHKTFHSG